MPPDISEKQEHENPFWRFSLDVYGRDEVKRACLALQEEAGADVNILLFLCWRAAKGFSPAPAESIAAMISAIEPVNREIIQPLRQVRRRLGSLPAAGAEMARGAVLKAELAGEQMAQTVLYARFGDAPPTPATPDTAGTAVFRYLDLLNLPASGQGRARDLAQKLISGVFF